MTPRRYRRCEKSIVRAAKKLRKHMDRPIWCSQRQLARQLAATALPPEMRKLEAADTKRNVADNIAKPFAVGFLELYIANSIMLSDAFDDIDNVQYDQLLDAFFNSLIPDGSAVRAWAKSMRDDSRPINNYYQGASVGAIAGSEMRGEGSSSTLDQFLFFLRGCEEFLSHLVR